MSQITVRLPKEVVHALHLSDEDVHALDTAAGQLECSPVEIIRQAVENYLEDLDDQLVVSERLRDPDDPVLDWDQTRRELLDSAQE